MGGETELDAGRTEPGEWYVSFPLPSSHPNTHHTTVTQDINGLSHAHSLPMHALATLGLTHPPRATQADTRAPATASIPARLEQRTNDHMNTEDEGLQVEIVRNIETLRTSG